MSNLKNLIPWRPWRPWRPWVLLTLSSFLGSILNGPLAYADRLDVVEAGFLSGYHAYQQQNYFNCAKDLETIKEHFELLPKHLEIRARLYHAYCHQQLGHPDIAQFYLQELNNKNELSEQGLLASDRAIYEDLLRARKTQPKVPSSVSGWILPYCGQTLLTPQTNTPAALVTGLYGGTHSPEWDFGVGAEIYSLATSRDSSAYSQSLLNVSISKTLSSLAALRSYLSITTSGNSPYGGTIGGLGTTLVLGPTTTFDLDFVYAQYPNLTIGNVAIPEITFSLIQNIIKGQKFELGMQITSETLLPKGMSATDPITGFALNSFYQRWALGLLSNLGPIKLNLNGWTGSEALGIRERGTLIPNGLKTYRYGFGGSLTYPLTSSLHIKLFASQEAFQSKGAQFFSTSLAGGLILNL